MVAVRLVEARKQHRGERPVDDQHITDLDVLPCDNVSPGDVVVQDSNLGGCVEVGGAGLAGDTRRDRPLALDSGPRIGFRDNLLAAPQLLRQCSKPAFVCLLVEVCCCEGVLGKSEARLCFRGISQLDVAAALAIVKLVTGRLRITTLNGKLNVLQTFSISFQMEQGC